MKVNLAGFNHDIDQINRFLRDLELKDSPDSFADKFRKIQLSPETISAAYARISRSKKPVDELRKIAIEDLEKARKSNRRIVFDMGHSSIAEHAVFNFDIIGVSRYLTEFIQRTRLASYTEKSQRYVTLDGDFVIPAELKKNPELEKGYILLINIQNKAYSQIYKGIKKYLSANSPSENKKSRAEKAKQDARYILSLATETQMGMTINARSLERLLKRLYALNLAEATDLADKMHSKVADIAPSLIRYIKPTDFDKRLYSRGEISDLKDNPEKVVLIDHTKDIENKVISTLLFRKTGGDFFRISKKVREMKDADKIKFVKEELRGLQPWNALPRDFEMGDFTFQLRISSSCFAQLKRHRLSSIIETDYHPKFGVIIPSTVINAGEKKTFENVIKKTNRFYSKLEADRVHLKNYILTNSHQRLVLFKFNLRELSHFARLRQDKHAQWEIRKIADQIVAKCKKIAPALTFTISGKDTFSKN